MRSFLNLNNSKLSKHRIKSYESALVADFVFTTSHVTLALRQNEMKND